eukprot:scaffold290051_cov14-Tisochrysis_lutea.AAC.1
MSGVLDEVDMLRLDVVVKLVEDQLQGGADTLLGDFAIWWSRRIGRLQGIPLVAGRGLQFAV